MAASLAEALAMPHVELDALQWESNWHGLTQHDPHEFIRRVAAATAADRWVVDGNYGLVRDLIWSRATHLVWLDYERRVIMARVIRRSLVRIACRTELWAGNREVWHRIFRPSHPILWAWNTWRRRRTEIEQLLAQPDNAHLTVLRLRRPCEASGVISRLKA